jgi:hypothetical protein
VENSALKSDTSYEPRNIFFDIKRLFEIIAVINLVQELLESNIDSLEFISKSFAVVSISHNGKNKDTWGRFSTEIEDLCQTLGGYLKACKHLATRTGNLQDIVSFTNTYAEAQF